MRNGFVLWYGDRRSMVLKIFLTAFESRPLDGDVVQRTVLVNWYLILERQRLPISVFVMNAFIFFVVGAHCRRLALRPHDQHLWLRLLGRRREAKRSYRRAAHSHSCITHRQPVNVCNIPVEVVDTLPKTMSNLHSYFCIAK